MIRLQKYLAQAGVASRRRAEVYIADGRVRVNGKIVADPGLKIDERCDHVLFDDKEIEHTEELRYYMLHKPEGVMTTVRDQFGRRTVIDLMPEADTRLYPVGRLDYDSSGLLIMTNDGELAYRLTHPKHMVDKVYIARLDGIPTTSDLNMFRNGITIDGRKTSPADIVITKSNDKSAVARITIREGRNRQVRKMCQAIGCPVQTLKRVAIGKLHLGELRRGGHRALSKSEIAYLLSLST